MRIGFIGLGQMGIAIARNLQKAGHELVVWNRSPEKAGPLLAAGATLAASPAGAAEGEVVFTMLSDDKALEAVAFGDEGILAGAAKAIHVSLSTISPALADRLAAAHAEAGGAFVSAPVFGRPAAAEAAKLFVVAAGPPEALTVCEPLFAAFDQHSFMIGDRPSEANLVKICGNFMIMAAIEAMAEAMTLAVKNGIDKATLLNVLTGTLFDAPVYRTYGDLLVAGKYRPAGFAAPLGLKDMNLVSAAADASRVPMPVLSVVRDHLLATIAREGDDIDWSAVAKTIAANAGL